MELSDKKNMTRHALRDRVFGLVFRIEFYPKEELEEQTEKQGDFFLQAWRCAAALRAAAERLRHIGLGISPHHRCE